MTCDLHRTEDRSAMEVYIAVPLEASVTIIVRIYRQHKKRPPAAYGLEQRGKEYMGSTIIRHEKQYEMEEDRVESPISPQPVLLLPPKIRIDEEAMKASYNFQVSGQLHEGMGLHRGMERKYSEESLGSIAIEQQPQPAFYDIERSGQLLEGKGVHRRSHKYESETSIDYEERAVGGGITHVTAIKKESHGRFDVTIECPNFLKPDIAPSFKEIPRQKFENMEFMKTIENYSTAHESSESLRRATNVFQLSQNIYSSGDAHIGTIYAFDNDKPRDFTSEVIRHTGYLEQIKHKTLESETEYVNLMLNMCGPIRDKPDTVKKTFADKTISRGHLFRTNAQSSAEMMQHIQMERKEYEKDHLISETVPFRTTRQESMQRQFREYSETNEHCAVMLENRGIAGERTTAEWGLPITGGMLMCVLKFLQCCTKIEFARNMLIFSLSLHRQSRISPTKRPTYIKN